jgi:hypothetical protein
MNHRVIYSKGLVRVPLIDVNYLFTGVISFDVTYHQVRNKLSPTVSATRAKALTAIVSIGRFSVTTCEIICQTTPSAYTLHTAGKGTKPTEGAALAKKIKLPRYAAPLYVKVPVALINAPTP